MPYCIQFHHVPSIAHITFLALEMVRVVSTKVMAQWIPWNFAAHLCWKIDKRPRFLEVFEICQSWEVPKKAENWWSECCFWDWDALSMCMKDKEYTQSFIPPSLRQLLQSEMTKCINGMQTSAHDSTVDPLNFHGHSTAQAISHASRHQRAPSHTMRRLGKETHKGLSMILFMCRAVFPLLELQGELWCWCVGTVQVFIQSPPAFWCSGWEHPMSAALRQLKHPSRDEIRRIVPWSSNRPGWGLDHYSRIGGPICRWLGRNIRMNQKTYVVDFSH